MTLVQSHIAASISFRGEFVHQLRWPAADDRLELSNTDPAACPYSDVGALACGTDRDKGSLSLARSIASSLQDYRRYNDL